MNQIPLFDELWDYEQPGQTEARLRALLPQAEAVADATYHVQLLSQIARAQGLQQQFEAAHALLDEAERLLAQAKPLARIRVCLERGRLLNSARTADRGQALFQEAWQLALAAKVDFYAIDAAHMLGIVAETADEQLAWNLKALQVAMSTQHARSRRWLGALYNNIGWTYHDNEQYEQALAMFEKARDYYDRLLDVPRCQIARWTIGRTYRSLGRVAEALAVQETLLAEYEADEAAGYTLEEMGECLWLLGRTAEAQPYFGRAYAVLAQDPWLAAHEPARLQRLQELWQQDL